MKCSNCPRFTSKNTDTDPEGDLDVDDNGMVSGDVRIVNECEECGGELEEFSFTVEIDLTDAVRQHAEAKHKPWLDNTVVRQKLIDAAKKLKPKPIDPATLDQFDKCANCGRYWISHRVPAKRGRPNKWTMVGHRDAAPLKDARKATCVEGNTQFTPAPKKTKRQPGGDASQDAPTLSVDAEISRTDEVVNKDRHGRPIKRSRYMKRLYGIHVDATIKCDACDEDIATGTYDDSVQASGMDWIG